MDKGKETGPGRRHWSEERTEGTKTTNKKKTAQSVFVHTSAFFHLEESAGAEVGRRLPAVDAEVLGTLEVALFGV